MKRKRERTRKRKIAMWRDIKRMRQRTRKRNRKRNKNKNKEYGGGDMRQDWIVFYVLLNPRNMFWGSRSGVAVWVS